MDEKMHNETTDATRKIADRLARAIATAYNDDYNRLGTRERERHIERIGAMNEARRFLLGEEEDDE